MKKRTIFGLFVAVSLLLLVVACKSDPPPPPPPPPDTGLIWDGATKYTVVQGDTLADIAATKWGGSNMYYFPLIKAATPDVVRDPDLIEIGDELNILDLQRNLDSDGAKAILKQEMLNIADQYAGQEKPNAAARLRSMANNL